MKIVGLITEYNPFHKGHLYHIEQAKLMTGADYVVVVMSGNYVQRGEPAIVDKWTRTKMALASGADLVIELPVHFATSSAEFFSSASISLLSQTGIITDVCFGSEVGTLDVLLDIAQILIDEPALYKAALKQYLQQGLRFPKARALAMRDYTKNSVYDDIIQSPNNILATEYLKALIKLKSTIKPHTIKRIGAGYHDEHVNHVVASASAIRKQLKQHNDANLSELLPSSSYPIMQDALKKGAMPIYYEDFYSLIKYKLLTTPSHQLIKILDVTEGLENRFIQKNKTSHNLSELQSQVATKRFTNTKINRALLHILLDIDYQSHNTFSMHNYVQYIKVLGYKKKSSEIMRLLKAHATLPIIVNTKDSMPHLTSLQRKMLEDEIKSTHIYNTIVYNKLGAKLKNDFTQQLIRYD